MRVIEAKVYEFSELSEEAKEKAREWFRGSSLDYEWWDGVFDTVVSAGGLMGINVRHIYFNGFASQGDGACFEGDYYYEKGSIKNIKKEFPKDEELLQIAKNLSLLQRNYSYKLEATVRHSGRYYNEHSVSIGVFYQYSELNKETEEGIEEALRDFMRWIYSLLEKEYVWLNSDEQIDENIIANGYEFTEEGERP